MMAGIATITIGAILLAPHDGPAHRIQTLTKRMQATAWQASFCSSTRVI